PTGSVAVEKPTPYTFDLGNLLANDANPLPPKPDEPALQAAARDAAQALVNQLLTTCPATATASGNVVLALPDAATPLPREKPAPAAKEPTAWERFAARKGIRAKRRDERGKLVYDEEKGEWVPRWGYKGKNKEAEQQWLVEVDAKREREKGEALDPRKESREARKERVKRNERKMRANERRSKKGVA
ncbi:ribosome biogenesis regulatory protein, partial [Lineolata rhizophorae]